MILVSLYLVPCRAGEDGGDGRGNRREGALKLHVNTFRGDLQLAALGDLDRLDGLVAGLGLGALNLLHHIKALENLAKDDVAAIEPAKDMGCQWPILTCNTLLRQEFD